jgi:thiol-disulfide isomerase/thioredoxin
MTDPTPVRPRRRWPLALVALAALAGAATLYESLHRSDKGASDCPAASAARLEALRPLAHGDVAALTLGKSPRAATPIAFKDADGKALTLADFKGRAVLLNLWATWCVPCRAEMPALDRLQAKAGSDAFQVVAVNVDTARLDKPKAFLDEIGVKSLPRYADSTGDAFEALRLAGKALGLPTSLLIDKDGCELGVVGGAAAWDSEDALKLIGAFKGA